MLSEEHMYKNISLQQ